MLPDDAEAGLVAFPVSTDWHLSAIRWWDAEFWNRSVTRAYVLPDGGHLYPNVHGAEFRRVMTSFLLESR